MGQRYLEVVSKSHVAELVAVVDVNRTRTSEVAARYGCQAFYDTQKMLDEVLVDVVMICTPDHLHVEPTLACAAAKKHTFLEKPIATTLEDADVILEAVAVLSALAQDRIRADASSLWFTRNTCQARTL